MTDKNAQVELDKIFGPNKTTATEIEVQVGGAHVATGDK